MSTNKQTSTTYSASTVFHNLWEIQQFYSAQAQGQQLKSEVFRGYSSHGSDCEVSWYYILEVTESDQIFSNNQFVMRFSVRITAVIESCNASLKAVVELVPDQYHTNNGLYKISGITFSGSQIGKIFINKENYLFFLTRDEDADTDVVTFRLNFSLVEKPMPQNSELLENYSSLLSNEQLSDVTIYIDDKKFYALKAILSVRSPVFAAMFESGMQESALNRVVIEDIEPEVFEEVLRFIYVGKVRGLDRMAHELLAAADKYALNRLRKMCERHLGGHITGETVLQTLALADLYHADELKERAVRYICGNIKTMQSTDWKPFAHAHPDLVAAILSAMTVD